MTTSIYEIEKYLKTELITFSWDDINIFCTDKDNNGRQLHIYFIKRPYQANSPVDYSLCITEYLDYIKIDDASWVDISVLGNKYKVLSTLIYNIMFKRTVPLKKTNVLVNVSTNTTEPIFRNAFNLIFDRTETTLLIRNECPVCLVRFKPSMEPVTLECHHKMCKSCLFNSLKHKLNSCPLCRHKIIDEE